MNEERLSRTVGALNSEQLNAIEHIVVGWRAPNGAVRLTIVDGPPGTGKTHVAAAAAGEWVRSRNSQVIVLTPTHQAAERVQELLMNVGFEHDEAIRLCPGRIGEISPGVLSFNRAENLPPNLIRKLRQASVLITTWHGSQRALGYQGFSIASSNSLLLLDEVSQIPFQAFLAILRRVYSSLGRKGLGALALLGDPHQLPVVRTGAAGQRSDARPGRGHPKEGVQGIKKEMSDKY